jgi:hypothetical protein
MQRVLIVLGLLLLLGGLLWPWLSKLPFGRLPGDVVVERENWRFYLPLGTMAAVSLILTLVLWLFRR